MKASQNIDMLLLQYAITHDMLDTAVNVQEQIEMTRKEILKQHKHKIWYNEKEGRWYTYLPAPAKDKGIKKVPRKDKKDLEQAIVTYYLEHPDEQTTKAETLEDLFREFMKHKKKQVHSGTIKRMLADWKRYYEPHKEFIQKNFQEITPIDVDDFFNDTVNSFSEPMNKKSFYNFIGMLKQTLEYAVDQGYLLKSPYRNKVNAKKLAPPKKKPASEEIYNREERKLLEAEMERRLANNPANTAPLAVMLDFELGARKGELLALRLSDIEDGRIHIQRQIVEEFDNNTASKSLGFHVAEYTKSEDGNRWLPLTQKAIDIIHRICAINKEYGHGYEDYIFVRNGRLLSPDAVDAQLKRGCEHIGIPLRTMHKIRKTYASNLLHNGASLSIVKDMLGHADESTTLKHYIFNTETDEETERIVLEALLQADSGAKKEKVTQVTQNVVPFRAKRKAATH